VGAVVGALSALLQLAPVLGRGYVLIRDMVFVPRLPLTDQLLGVNSVPRAVPSDLLVALASRVVPGDVVQDVVLFAIIGLAGWGAARLVPGESRVAAAGAAALYSWNPYVTEHLVQGQWAVLIGYAALPWVASTALGARAGGAGARRRLLVALLLAATGGVSAELLAVLVAVPVVLWPGGAVAWPRRAATLTASIVVVSLPWLVPSLMQTGDFPGDKVGVRLFAARADTPYRTVGSLASLGGIWNAQVVPPGRGSALVGLAALLMTVAALGVLWLTRSRWAPGGLAGLVTAAAVGFLLSLWGATPGVRRLLVDLTGSSVLAGLLRDGQRSLAPFVLVVAVGFGLAVEWAAARVPVGRLLVLAPALLLTSAAWGADGALAAVSWPTAWPQIASASRSLPSGPVLVLPWSSQRSYAWNDGRDLDDPAASWLPRRTVADDSLTVGRVATPLEDPLARSIAATATGAGQLLAPLRAQGYAGVLVEWDQPGALSLVTRLQGLQLVRQSSALALYAVPDPAAITAGRRSTVPPLAGDLVALVVGLGAITSLLRIETRRG
jgi:hypothetical protein